MAVSVASGETVFVLDRRTKVYVLGKVRNPGAIQYRKGMTISEAVALAGGLDAGCAENRTRVISTNVDGSRTVRELNLVKVLSPGDGESFSDIEVTPWTIIFIPESRI
jgi:protein involved in polysaccharide export with SLBB domain